MRCKQIHKAWVILACCCMMMGMTYGIEGGTTGSFFLPISETFNCSVGRVSFYVSIKGIVSVLTIPIVVKQLKKGNTRKLLSSATIGYIISLVCMAFAPSIPIFYISAVFLGISGAFLSTITVPTIINLWFSKKMSFALGLSMATSGIFGSLASPIINRSIVNFGWRLSYLFIALSIAILLLPLMVFVIDLKPVKSVDAYGGNVNRITCEEQEVEIIYRRSFILTILFGVMLAFSTGMLFNLPSMLMLRGTSGQISAYLVSTVLMGATIWKIFYGYLLDRISMRMVQPFAILSGVIGLWLLKDTTQIEYLFLGALLYGSIVSLMTLLPPLMLKICFRENVYSYLLTYVSMAVQFAYALAPMIFANMNSIFTHQQVIFICMIISIIALLLGCFNLKDKKGRNIC